MWCKHKWTKVSEVIGDPPIVTARDNGCTSNYGAATLHNYGMFTKVFVLVMVCTECGKVHKVREKL